MGRGRAKAKQAKVARQLKYAGSDTDLDALRKELASGPTSSASAVDVDDEFENDDDEDDDDDESLGASHRSDGVR